eukprot:5264390-Karenia_brevis.AAC.1
MVGKAERVGKNFTIKFTGPQQTAARRAHKALNTLRDDQGKWEPVYCKATNGSKTQMFISPDRNGRQKKTATSVKRAAKILAEAHP